MPARLSCGGADRCCCTQVATLAAQQVPCKRTMSALLPAAELLLRGVLDWRHEHWHEHLSSVTKQGMVEEVRCMAIMT